MINKLKNRLEDFSDPPLTGAEAREIIQQLEQADQMRAELDSFSDLLTKAIGDITAALIWANKADKIVRFTAPYIEALNNFDAACEISMQPKGD